MTGPGEAMTVEAHAPMDARPVLIDALNLAYWCGAPPSLRIPMAAMSGLLSAGLRAWLVFDSSARYRLGAESGLYAHLLRHTEHVIEVPSGQPADRLLLRRATRLGARVLSRDRYRDHRRRHRRLIDDPARLLAGEVREDQLHLPRLALTIELPPTAQAACNALEPQLMRDRIDMLAIG